MAEEVELRDLVRRAAAGEPDAWECLYRRAYPKLFAYARRRLSSADAADDAVSETMVRALDRMPSFRWKGAGVDAWLYGILRNVVQESWRDNRRTRPQPALLDDPVAGPLEGIVRREQLDEVRAAFAELAAEDQEVLELRVVGGLNADEVGDVLGRRSGAVRMAQSRALGRLRSRYAEVSGDR